MLEMVAGWSVGEFGIQRLGGKGKTDSQLLYLEVVWQELTVCLCLMSHGGHFQALMVPRRV